MNWQDLKVGKQNLALSVEGGELHLLNASYQLMIAGCGDLLAITYFDLKNKTKKETVVDVIGVFSFIV